MIIDKTILLSTSVTRSNEDKEVKLLHVNIKELIGWEVEDAKIDEHGDLFVTLTKETKI